MVLSTSPMIRSPQLRGQGLPPDSPSPLGGSVDTCRGVANGCADLPHFCYPVASFRPLSPERTRMNRCGTPYITCVPSERMLDRMTLDTKRRKSRQRAPRTPRSAIQRGRPPRTPPRRLAASLAAAGGQPGASVTWISAPEHRRPGDCSLANKTQRNHLVLWIDVPGQMRRGRICFEAAAARHVSLRPGPVQLTIDFGKSTWS
jgi:hypothetical protein